MEINKMTLRQIRKLNCTFPQLPEEIGIEQDYFFGKYEGTDNTGEISESGIFETEDNECEIQDEEFVASIDEQEI